ncbi:MAG: response regulator [Candidatus Omnitrophota bacterium]
MGDKLNVFLVDDELDFVTMLKYWLEKKDFNVNYALNGQTALENLKKEKADILFLDLKLPDCDGVDLLKQIRESNPQLPVVIISAYGTQEKMKEATKLGISGFFAKEDGFAEAAQMIYTTLRIHKGLGANKKNVENRS